ncbi:MAG: lipocalin family protein [Flavobacteriales bacterium]|nr:lipocalin family protein [Flavobacteriales bacterium]
MFKTSIYYLAIILLFTACGSGERPLDTVDQVDLEKYMGKWYEIERLPNKFEAGLKCVTAEYTLLEDGNIKVLNSGINEESGELKSSEGIAKSANKDAPGELKVSFFRPFYGDYFIMELDENYQYVLVGAPSRDFLWILSRTPALDENMVSDLKLKAELAGFPVKQMKVIDQDCGR